MNKKIDIYLKNLKGFWQYECSTTWSKSCKQAQRSFCIKHALDDSQVKCLFSKPKGLKP